MMQWSSRYLPQSHKPQSHAQHRTLFIVPLKHSLLPFPQFANNFRHSHNNHNNNKKQNNNNNLRCRHMHCARTNGHQQQKTTAARNDAEEWESIKQTNSTNKQTTHTPRVPARGLASHGASGSVAAVTWVTAPSAVGRATSSRICQALFKG